MSWEELISIYREQNDSDRAYEASQPTACPNDGIPLITGPDGVLFCKADGWHYNGNRKEAY